MPHNDIYDNMLIKTALQYEVSYIDTDQYWASNIPWYKARPYNIGYSNRGVT